MAQGGPLLSLPGWVALCTNPNRFQNTTCSQLLSNSFGIKPKKKQCYTFCFCWVWHAVVIRTILPTGFVFLPIGHKVPCFSYSVLLHIVYLKKKVSGFSVSSSKPKEDCIYSSHENSCFFSVLTVKFIAASGKE